MAEETVLFDEIQFHFRGVELSIMKPDKDGETRFEIDWGDGAVPIYLTPENIRTLIDHLQNQHK